MVVIPDPSNFRSSWFHARDYGLIAANPFGRQAMKQGEKSAVKVKKGEEFHLRFGILIYRNPNGEKLDIEDAYENYLNTLKNE